MIFDRLKNAEIYYSLNKNLKKGFEFLLNSDLNLLPDGKYEIDGKTVFANIQTLKTKPIEEKKWEAHRKYIDIQYVIKAKEKMGYGILEDFKSEIAYDPERDVEFFEGEKFNFIDVYENDFVIFFPNDAHAPMLQVEGEEEIKKVIVKVKI